MAQRDEMVLTRGASRSHRKHGYSRARKKAQGCGVRSREAKVYSYIRFSTPEQAKGTSLERQMGLARGYANTVNIALDTTLNLMDRGISAFRGVHRQKGALGRFMELVRSGHIPKGSVLAVESLDRLSREGPFGAFTLLTEIISSGVDVKTFQPDRLFTRERLNEKPGEIYEILGIMSRAHEESTIKSMRMKAARSSERIRAREGKKILSGHYVKWVEPNRDGSGFKVIPERAEIVRLIFELALTGWGAQRIATDLNKDGVPSWGKNGWRETYIKKILRNPAVIGICQPHMRKEGKRVPEGEPIVGYYPQVIEDDVYYSLQARFRANIGKGGPTGKVSNLFGHLAKCPYCGAPMAYQKKGDPPRAGSYLVCDNARRGLKCKAIKKVPIRYDRFEKVILLYCRGLKVEDIIPQDVVHDKEITALQKRLNTIDGQVGHLQALIRNDLNDRDNFTTNEKMRATLLKRAEGNQEKLTKLEAERTETERTLHELEHAEEQTQERITGIKELIERMSVDKSPELRIKVRTKLRELIRKIMVYPYGTKQRPVYPMKYLLNEGILTKKEFDATEASMMEYIGPALQAYRVYFKSGVVREIRPRLHRTIVTEFVGHGEDLISRIWAYNEEGTILQEIILGDKKIFGGYRGRDGLYKTLPKQVSTLIARDLEYGLI